MKYILLLSLIMASNIWAKETLKVIGDFNIPTGEKFKDTEIGGLSGIYYDAKNNKLVTVSDDRGNVNSPRFYEFELSLDEKSFSVKPSNVITVKDKTQKPFAKHATDFEGITMINGTVYISSEGALNSVKPINPGVFKFNYDGSYVSELAIPEKFLMPKEDENKKFGPRDNLVFEALTSTRDGKAMFLGMEEALLQDDQVTTPTYQSKTRIIKFVDDKPVKEIAYELETVPTITVAGLTVGETGLVDMAAIDENTSYTMERAYMPLAKKTVIRIFKIKDIDKAQDVTNIESLKKHKDLKPVEKELILNLEDILPSLSEKFRTTDNIEGLCLGPKLKNGHDTLIVVSDNNFSKTQRTQFIAFEIIP